MAYVHMIESRDNFSAKIEDNVNTLDLFRKVWKEFFVSAGGYTTKSELATKMLTRLEALLLLSVVLLQSRYCPSFEEFSSLKQI